MVTPIARRSVSEAAAASGSRGRRRSVVEHLRTACRVSERRACRVTGFHRSSQRYRSRRDPQVELRMRLKELAAARVRYGYRRLHVLLRREGWPVDAKRVHRLHREEGLAIRPKLPRRKRAWRYRQGRPVPLGAANPVPLGAANPVPLGAANPVPLGAANEAWAMDFMSDQLFDGRPFRILTVIDGHTREALATVPRTSFRAYQVAEILDWLVMLRGRPKSLRVDNGPEFAGKVLDQWAYLNGVEIDFSRPGRSTDNGLIEAFNARLRAECLNASWFLSLADARDRIEAWRCGYNHDRPHSASGNLTPKAFARQAHQARRVA
jgi:putative transposase